MQESVEGSSVNAASDSNMSSNNKVIDLQQRQAAQASSKDRQGELLRSVRAIALKRVNALVSSLFENIDDALFDLAEKAENNAMQVQYFDGMREVRKKRQLVERLFQEQLGKVFNDFAAGKLQPARSEVPISAQQTGMALVEDHELEESLAVASMVAKAENRLARPLYAANQRLSVIIGGHKVDDSCNPIGPAPLCQAFRIAVNEFEVTVQVKLIVYKLFDRYVMSKLDTLYDEVNTHLIQAGVLPQVRVATPPSQPTRPSAGMYAPGSVPGAVSGQSMENMPALPSAGAGYGYVAGYDPAVAHLQSEIYHTLRDLLANRRDNAAEPIDATIATGSNNPVMLPSLSPTELLGALTILQTQATRVEAQANKATDAALAVQQVKEELLDQAGKFSGDTKARVSGADEDTIDLVGMLFEFILQDRNLPPEMQALLARLQIPFLKVAILDKHLFAQKAHPARQLLDTLAQVCVGWSEESDRDHRLYDKIKEVVDSLLKDFDDDLSVFEHAQKDFLAFVENHKKRAELAEQRAAEATRGREKLHVARRSAAREILKRIEGRQLPQVVHTILSRPWANYLVLTLLRQGEESAEWKTALRFADEFVWSVEPKPTHAEKLRLKGILPVLEKNLRHCLTTVAYHENDVKHLMQELHGYYQQLLTSGAAAANPVASAEVIASVSAPEIHNLASSDTSGAPSEEETLLGATEEVEEMPREGDVDDAHLQLAKEMKVGTWVEFTDPINGGKERAKLSWISPISAKYLFVNRKGLKVSDKTVFALAEELYRGTAVVLEEVPLFDRALDAIVERLKSAHNQPEQRPSA